MQIDLNKALSIVSDTEFRGDLSTFRADLSFALNSLAEEEVNRFFDAVAEDEIDGEFEKAIPTVIPEEDKKEEKQEPEPPQEGRQDIPGGNRVWRIR